MKKTILYLLVVVMLPLLGQSCSSSDSDPISIEAIKIDSEITIRVNQSKNVLVSVIPEELAGKVDLQWSSSSESIFTVNSKGEIFGIAEGEGTLTVFVLDNSEVQAKSKITVIAEIEEEPDDEFVVTFEDTNLASRMLFYDKDQDGKLQYREAKLIKELNLAGSNIKSIEGLEYLRELEVLNLRGNQIDSADFYYNKKLKALYLGGNILTQLNVSTLNELEKLSCEANRLSAIDVTNNLNLIELNISMNHEGRAEGSKGIIELDITKNPKLEKLNMNYINVSNLDLTQNKELKWLDCGLASYTSPYTDPITELDLSNNTKLEYLRCDAMVRTYNMDGELIEDKVGLSSLDLSMLPNLKSLNCIGNSLKELDLTNNLKLSTLLCSNNYLTTLDLSKNTGLDTLVCKYNQIDELLFDNAPLRMIDCSNNMIKYLDVSKTKLSYLLAQNNQITDFVLGDKVFDTLGGFPSGGAPLRPYLYLKLNDNKISDIDVAKQVNLAWLEINNNNLSRLDISNCIELGGVLANNNNISEFVLGDITRLWEIRLKNNKLQGELDLTNIKFLSTLDFRENLGLKNIYVPNRFDEECTAMIVDHITGQTKVEKCFLKDASATWVKVD